MNRISNFKVDELDLMLLNELETDAGKKSKDLAIRMNMSQATLRRKIQRLEEAGMIQFCTMVNFMALGYRIMALFGINTLPGKSDAVMAQLVSFPCVYNVVLTTGRYDIFAWTSFTDNEHMLRFFSQRLGTLTDVVSIETFIALRLVQDYWKPGWWCANGVGDGSPGQQNIDYTIDKIDSLIIRELKADPRATTVALSKKIGISQSSVHKRLQLLFHNEIIQIGAFANQSALGYNIRALILVKVEPCEIDSISNHLLNMSAVKHVSIMTGSFPLYVWARFRDSDDLHSFLTNELGVIPGVRSHETSVATKTGKLSWPDPINDSTC